METIRVNLPTSPYPIHVSSEEEGWADPLADLVRGKRPVVVTDRRVARFCLPQLKKELRRLRIPFREVILPDGERFKNLSTVARLYGALVRQKVDRTTPILLLGGGVLGDLGGFAAATYLRGVPFIQIPTTLIGQVDAAIGGKLGVDLKEGKNLVGVFCQPQAVLTHIPFLQSLPKRDLTGGLAEVLKYGVIRDPDLFEFVLEQKNRIFDRETAALSHLVVASSRIKGEVVAADEREVGGIRMILNFGHTFGHAIEKITRYRRFHHGEAIAIGMGIAARLSCRRGFCPPEAADRLLKGLAAVGLPASAPSFSKAAWTRALEVDKKGRDGMIHFVFMRTVGEVFVAPAKPADLIKLL